LSLSGQRVKHNLVFVPPEEERKALGSLPVRPFNVERFERVSTDGYGKFCVDCKHWYSSAPEYGNSQLIVGLKALSCA